MPTQAGSDPDCYQVELAQGVFSFHATGRGFGHSNVGLIIGADGHTVIDTGPTPAWGRGVRADIELLTSGLDLPFRRVVLTSSRIPFSGGTRAFPEVAIHTSDPTSDELDAPANPHALAALLPMWADVYLDEEFSTRPATHTITEEAWITDAARAVAVAGESTANLLVELPAAGVVFAGALASFGVTPLAFDGDPAAWAEALRPLGDFEGVVIPGHGPPGSGAEISDLVGYLDACVTADGDPDALARGPWESWTNRDFDAVNTERAARLRRGDRSIPQSMLALLGLT